MIGGDLVNKILAAIYRRGRGLVETQDRAAEERRTIVRSVRDSVSEAMTFAENDREHGLDSDQKKAIAAANRASSTVHEIPDQESRELVVDWKAQFDAIPKGWKHPDSYASKPPGYPEPAWTHLRAAADEAIEQLGTVLRGLLG